MVSVIGTDDSWVEVQHRTFTLWLNTQLGKRPEIEPAEDIVTALGDGIKLIQLLEIISNEPLGKFNKSPRLRVQKAENVNIALDFIRSKHIPLTNIGAEDIIDGNLKLMCGLLWTLILRFTIADINVDGLTAKEGLLLWCQRKTMDYADVDVRNFTSSWTDGLAFCALLHRYRPDLILYDELDKNAHQTNMNLAFTLAHEHIGISRLLEVKDVCDISKPDERSVMTYIAQWFHAFSHLDKIETAGRRVEKFAEMMRSVWSMKTDYEVRMKILHKSIESLIGDWHVATFSGAYEDAKEQSVSFLRYKGGIKRDWIREKMALESLLGNIQTKLNTYGLKHYSPPPNYGLADLDFLWQHLLSQEATRSKTINSKIRDIKEDLRRSFADHANEFARMLQTLATELSSLQGDLEDQLEVVANLVEHLEPLQFVLAELKTISEANTLANVEENDYTIYDYADMEYEFRLARESIQKKYKFIENQIIARSGSNITPAQIEEIDSVFRHFDRSDTNCLSGASEFPAALASLGLTYEDEELEEILRRVGDPDKTVTWEAFLTFIIEELEDQNTPEQVLNAFRDVADGKAFVTQDDLKESLVQDTATDFLMHNLPAHNAQREDPSAVNGLDYVAFMADLIDFHE